MLCATNGFSFIYNNEIDREMVWKEGLHLTNYGTTMLDDNFTKYLNMNLGIDFNVNNFNNDFLDRQLSRLAFNYEYMY